MNPTTVSTTAPVVSTPISTPSVAAASTSSPTVSATATWTPPQTVTVNLGGGETNPSSSVTPSTAETAQNPISAAQTTQQVPTPVTVGTSASTAPAQTSNSSQATTIDVSQSTTTVGNIASGLQLPDTKDDQQKAGVSGSATDQQVYDRIAEANAKANAEAIAAVKKAADDKAAADAAAKAAADKAAADAKKPVVIAPSTNVQTNKANIAAALAIPATDIDGTSLENIVLKRDSPAVLKALNIPTFGGYPAKWRDGIDKDAVGDDWGMKNRECVSYAAFKVNVDAFPRKMPYWGGKGNAWQWENDAKQAGIPVDTIPAIGSVMQWGKKAGAPHGSLGHVAYVEKILADGSVVTTEYNNGGQGTFSIHVYPPSYLKAHADQVKFIHFEK